MPTYDYQCNDCGFEAEYPNTPSNRDPPCLSCRGTNMKRLPSRINIGEGLEGREANIEDVSGPMLAGIRIVSGEVDCPCGYRGQGIVGVEPIIIDNGPSEN